MSAHDKITARVLEIIETEQAVPWRRPWSSSAPRNLRGNLYRGVNRLMLSLASYGDPRWLTLRQCNELGGRIRKGERGTPLVLWREVEAEDGGERWVSRLYHVFNVEQAEGLDLQPFERSVSPGSEACEKMERLVAGMPLPPRMARGEIACYIPSKDTVVVPRRELFESEAAYCNTLAHEAIHATGHESRLARPDVMNPAAFGGSSYAFEELVAELGACFLCSELGIENDLRQSAEYVRGWLEALSRDKTMVVRAASAAQKAADYVAGEAGNPHQSCPSSQSSSSSQSS
jgi:antirestriction protein ArdC